MNNVVAMEYWRLDRHERAFLGDFQALELEMRMLPSAGMGRGGGTCAPRARSQSRGDPNTSASPCSI